MSCRLDPTVYKESELLAEISRTQSKIIMSRQFTHRIGVAIHEDLSKIQDDKKSLFSQLKRYREVQNSLVYSMQAGIVPVSVNKELEPLFKRYTAVIQKNGALNAKVMSARMKLVETEKDWNRTPLPPFLDLARMTSKERQGLVRMWKEREGYAVYGRLIFEDLKAEWDAMKGELEMDVLDCIQQVEVLIGLQGA